MSRARIGIIGGGYAGLTAAYELQKQGYDVTVLEKYGAWGGQAATLPLLDTRIEYFYHHLFGSDSHILGLMDELGIGDRLRWIESKLGVFSDGQIYDFVTPFDLLRFRPLSLLNRIKMGFMYLYLQRVDDWQRLEGITARDWILRYMLQANDDPSLLVSAAKVWGARDNLQLAGRTLSQAAPAE